MNLSFKEIYYAQELCKHVYWLTYVEDTCSIFLKMNTYKVQCQLGYFLLHKKLLQFTRLKHNTFIICQFLWVRSLSWVLCSGTHKAAIKVSPELHSHLETQVRKTASKISQVISLWLHGWRFWPLADGQLEATSAPGGFLELLAAWLLHGSSQHDCLFLQGQ